MVVNSALPVDHGGFRALPGDPGAGGYPVTTMTTTTTDRHTGRRQRLRIRRTDQLPDGVSSVSLRDSDGFLLLLDGREVTEVGARSLELALEQLFESA